MSIQIFFFLLVEVWKHGKRRSENTGGGKEVSVRGAVSGFWGGNWLSTGYHRFFSPHNLMYLRPFKVPISSVTCGWCRTATTRQSWVSMIEPWKLQPWWRAWRERWSFSVWLVWRTSSKQMSDQHWSSSEMLELRLAVTISRVKKVARERSTNSWCKRT